MLAPQVMLKLVDNYLCQVGSVSGAMRREANPYDVAYTYVSPSVEESASGGAGYAELLCILRYDLAASLRIRNMPDAFWRILNADPLHGVEEDAPERLGVVASLIQHAHPAAPFSSRTVETHVPEVPFPKTPANHIASQNVDEVYASPQDYQRIDRSKRRARLRNIERLWGASK